MRQIRKLEILKCQQNLTNHYVLYRSNMRSSDFTSIEESMMGNTLPSVEYYSNPQNHSFEILSYCEKYVNH